MKKTLEKDILVLKTAEQLALEKGVTTEYYRKVCRDEGKSYLTQKQKSVVMSYLKIINLYKKNFGPMYISKKLGINQVTVARVVSVYKAIKEFNL